MHSPEIAERFWKKVDKQPGRDACWLWTASCVWDGYGQFGMDGTMRRAHRVAWELCHKRRCPKDKVVRHRCHTPLCVRPSHLRLGTVADNNRDMNELGRNVFQTRNPSKKLNDAQVRRIRKLRAKGLLLRVIGARFGVSESTVCNIALRRTRLSI